MGGRNERTLMNRLALITIIALASVPAWAAAIVSTQTGSAQNITTEHLLFTITASGEQVLMFQPSVSGLNAAAANIQFRLAHSLGNNTVVNDQQDIVARAKYAAANTYYGCQEMGPITLKNGEKALFYALSSNASDTSVTYVVDVIDALALPTGAATAAAVGTPAQTTTVMSADVTSVHGAALTESTHGYLAAGISKMYNVQTPLMTVAAQVPTAAQNAAQTWEIQTSAGGATGTYGELTESLVRSTTPANTLSVDTGHQVVALISGTKQTLDSLHDAPVLTKNGVFTVTLENASVGETWKLMVDSTPTAAIAYNASANTVAAALEAISGYVQIFWATGEDGGPYRIEVPYASIIDAGDCTGDLTIDIDGPQEFGPMTGQDILTDVETRSTATEINSHTDSALANMVVKDDLDDIAKSGDAAVAVEPLLTSEEFSNTMSPLGDIFLTFSTKTDLTTATSTITSAISTASSKGEAATYSSKGEAAAAFNGTWAAAAATEINSHTDSALTSVVSTIGGYITTAQGVITGAITTSQGVVAGLVWTQLLSSLDDTENTVGHKLYNFLVNGKTGGTGT